MNTNMAAVEVHKKKDMQLTRRQPAQLVDITYTAKNVTVFYSSTAGKLVAERRYCIVYSYAPIV